MTVRDALLNVLSSWEEKIKTESDLVDEFNAQLIALNRLKLALLEENFVKFQADMITLFLSLSTLKTEDYLEFLSVADPTLLTVIQLIPVFQTSFKILDIYQGQESNFEIKVLEKLKDFFGKYHNNKSVNQNV